MAVTPASCNSDPTVWPNCNSSSNSDPSFVASSDAFQQLQPRVLVLNFDNDTNAAGQQPAQMPKPLAEQLVAAWAEATRYHGSPSPSFLAYQLLGVVDMTDAHGARAGCAGAYCDGGAGYHNSTWLPRRVDPSCAGPGTEKTCRPWQIDYSQLLTREYARKMGIRDPTDSSRFLSLCEMFQQGIVNEVWIYADGTASPPDTLIDEMLESKQAYDQSMAAVSGKFDAAAGNGSFHAIDAAALAACGVTTRFVGLSTGRGVGCMLHAAGHGIESEILRGPVPYFRDNGVHYLNFDLTTRLGLPFDRWYGCPYGPNDCIQWTGEDSLTYTMPVSGGTTTGPIGPYDQGCGSVHFPPNARRQYDYGNLTDTVLQTCAGYGMGLNSQTQLPDYASDPTDSYSAAALDALPKVAPDCGGPWVLYWMQNMPGPGNASFDRHGAPMKNWWPFLFY
jgi:hypothetical protein